MSVYSMTGYASVGSNASERPADEVGHAGGERASGGSMQVEIRAVNGRFLDLSMRMPDELRGLEPALREIVAAEVRRGKLELRLSTGSEASSAWPQPRPEQLSRLAALQDSVRGWLPQAAPLSVHEVLGWCRGTATATRDDQAVLTVARRAVQQLQASRAAEGARLAQALMERVRGLRALADQAEPLVPELVQRQRERFVERWNEALTAAEAAGGTPLPDEARGRAQERALAEAVAFAIRIDVAEELTRLRSHLDAIEQMLERGGELGKKLDFLVQELLREANTLGSKATSLELTRISVDMKVLIEQVREQVQNLE